MNSARPALILFDHLGRAVHGTGRTSCSDFLVTREAPHRLIIMEPLETDAPSIARPYCCYISTVIFYVWPHEVVRYGRNTGGFREWDRCEHLIRWDTECEYEGDRYVCGGGHVLRHRKRWWMRFWARRLHNQNGPRERPGKTAGRK